MKKQKNTSAKSNTKQDSPFLMMSLRVLVLILGIIVAMWCFAWVLKWVLPSHIRSQLGPLNAMTSVVPAQTILLMGVDVNSPEATDPFEGARSDTMMLVRLLPENETLSVINLPRDSKVYLDEAQTSIGKLNSAHALGGPEKTIAVLQHTLGFNIDRYLAIDLRGVRDVVDALGGVDMYVERPMRYHDNSAGLHINFSRGWHHLDGADAERYIRFRHDAYGDIGRIRRQQVFMDALKRKLMEPSSLVRLPQLLETAQRYVRTNLAWNDMLGVAQYVQQTPKSRMRFATLPGHVPMTGSVSYWVIDVKESTTLLERLLFGKQPPVETDPDPQIDHQTGQPTSTLPSIGLFYPKQHQSEADALSAKLIKAGFTVRCQREKNAAMTQLMDHTLTISEATIHQLQQLGYGLNDARVNFVPRSSSLLPLTCSDEAVTLVLGHDAFPTESASTES
jgi:LCP family protein required for cell wall assembly